MYPRVVRMCVSECSQILPALLLLAAKSNQKEYIFTPTLCKSDVKVIKRAVEAAE